MNDAARRLAEGELVAFPTETVYGLGGDATNPDAVGKIFALKGRPPDHPLIVHLADASRIDHWAAEVPAQAMRLIEAFWPGPLTLILKKAARVAAIVTGGQATVGLRSPSHPVARELLLAFAAVGSGAIAAPSANRFGHVSPTTAQHVRDEFGPDLTVLDGGACEVGIESTIVDLSRGRPVLLRPGAITREQLAALVGSVHDRDGQAPRASGTLAAHYAPLTPLEVLEGSMLAARLRAAALRGQKVVVLEVHGASAPAYAHDLYAKLRALDASGAELILVEAPPASGDWEAVNDRLARAAAGAAQDDET